jgi:ABC-type uncharacterized transport system substrate-binding protein
MAARKVGFLHNGTKGSFQKQYAAFVSRLHDFIEEEDVKIEEKWAGDEPSRTLDQHAKELADQGVNVIVAAGGPPSAVGHILDGEKPSDLPVALPDRFEFVINIKAAYAEGFRIPASLLSRAVFVRSRLRMRRAIALASGEETYNSK